MILHKKEIGTGESISSQSDMASKKQKKEKNVLDDDGFMVIKKK